MVAKIARIPYRFTSLLPSSLAFESQSSGFNHLVMEWFKKVQNFLGQDKNLGQQPQLLRLDPATIAVLGIFT